MRELELREFKDFRILRDYFKRTYFENYQSYVRLSASGALTEYHESTTKKIVGTAAAATSANKPSVPAAAAATTGKWTQLLTGPSKPSSAKDSKGYYTPTPLEEVTC